MVKSIPTEKINKSLFSRYLDKADEFYKLMQEADSQGLWNGVGLNAVHCAISSCDALTTFYLGERSRSEKHSDVTILLSRVPIDEMSNKLRQVTSILAIKNLVEYEARAFNREDAQRIFIQTERFYNWVRDNLPA